MLTTITIKNLRNEPVRKNAVVDGVFAITPGHPIADRDVLGVWTVTHVPTGTAVLTVFSPVDARRAQVALSVTTLDWRSAKLTRYRSWRKYRRAVYAIQYQLRKTGMQVVM